MIFYPNLYLNNVKEISIEILRKYNIKGLILDVDNTLIDFEHNMLEGLQGWCSSLKEQRHKDLYVIKYKQFGKSKKSC
ncbi:MAG: hypothetical protein FWC53_02375 [Firmicutes bacterium]|nr:hypothetical protein [Bacillota bacterium]